MIKKKVKVFRWVKNSRWSVRSYRRDAIPNIGWMVVQGASLIMDELTKERALELAEAHNSCLFTLASDVEISKKE